MKYRVKLDGVIEYSKMVEVLNEEGMPVMVNDTAGISVERYIEAETHLEAKQVLKDLAAGCVETRGGVGFTGSVSAWVITEEQLLDMAPFTVEVSIVQDILVDF